MDSLQDSIVKSIKNILPGIDAKKAVCIAQDLIAGGILNMGMLTTVEAQDLSDTNNPNCLGIYAARQLVQSWRNTNKEGDNPTRENLPGPSTLTMPSSNYRVDWKKLPQTAVDKLRKGEHVTSAQANAMVALIVEDVIQKVPNVGRRFFKKVESSMKRDFNKGQLDYYIKKKEDGTETLQSFRIAYKMQNKFDNDNRCSTKPLELIEAPGIPAAYGCIKWKVVNLPENETEETLEEKSIELQGIFQGHRSTYDWTQILNLMDITYALQRKMINSQCSRSKHIEKYSTSKIQEEFPFLFTYKGISNHFRVLTGIHAEPKLLEFMDSVRPWIKFLHDKTVSTMKIKNRMDRAIDRKSCNDPRLIAATLMVSQAFKENVDYIVQVVEKGTKMENISQECEMPPTPCIFACGASVFRSKKFYVSVDGEARIVTARFSQALLSMMAAYFTFNVQYAQEATNTLDFIQRVILDYNPVSGTKTNKKRKRGQQNNISPQLDSLLKTFQKQLEKENKEVGSDNADTPDEEGE